MPRPHRAAGKTSPRAQKLVSGAAEGGIEKNLNGFFPAGRALGASLGFTRPLKGTVPVPLGAGSGFLGTEGCWSSWIPPVPACAHSSLTEDG